MNQDQFEREGNFSLAMAIIRSLQKKGLLTATEVAKIRTSLIERFKGNVHGQYFLGRCFFYGEGVVKDVNKAFQLFTKAAPKIIQYAEQGYAAEQFYTGVLYYNGWGVEKHKKTAQFWFEKAAKMGLVQAQVFLKKHMKFGKLW